MNYNQQQLSNMVSTPNSPRSMKHTWVLLCGSSVLKSKEFLGTELELSAKQIISGILYYKPRQEGAKGSNNISQELKSIPTDFIEKMSIFLNLEQSQCYEVFSAYLTYEFKGTTNNIRTLFTNEKQNRDFLFELWDFFYSERLFSLFCLKQILCHFHENSQHPYRELFRSFLEQYNDDSKILENLFQQLEWLHSCPTPNRFTNGAYFSEHFSNSWTWYTLKEQCEILQILLLYFRRLETNTEHIIKLIKLFNSNAFGNNIPFAKSMMKQPFTSLPVDGYEETIFETIGFLESLILVECLDVSWFNSCQQQNINEHHLLKDEALLKDLDKLILQLSSTTQQHSPIFLAWMLIRSWELPNFDNSNSAAVVKHFGTGAVINLDVFGYLNRCLQLPLIKNLEESVISDAICCIIEQLVGVLMSTYNIEAIGDIDSLCALVTTVFQNNQVAESFFNDGLSSGLGLIVNAVLKNFPLEILTFLKFCNGLATTKFCAEIFNEMSIVSNITRYTEEYSAALSAPAEQNSIYFPMRERNLFSSNELFLSLNTVGHARQYKGKTVIEWDVNFDGWKVLHYRMKELFNTIRKGQLYVMNDNDFLEFSQIVSFFAKIISRCDRLNSIINDAIPLCIEAFVMLTAFQKPPCLIVTSILELMLSLISRKWDGHRLFWQRIIETKFFPYMIGLTSDLKVLISGNDTNASMLGELICSEESCRGEYKLTKVFLTLLGTCLEKGNQELLGSDRKSLLASIIFALRDILPSHTRWQYQDYHDRQEIGKLCFDIFHRIFSLHNKNDSLNPIEKVCVSSFMEGVAAETLLNVIKSSEKSVKTVINDVGIDSILLTNNSIIMVRKALSILNKLLALHNRHKICSSTAIENALFNSQNRPNMLVILSHYVFQRNDTRLATLAVQLLKRLAKQFPMSMLACFGLDAEPIRDHFLFRLDAVTEDLRLKVAILEFLAVCVQHQPGLMELFLNVDPKNDANTEGCLFTVLEILEEKKEEKYFCSYELHCSALKFLCSFWQQPHLLAIDSLKKRNNVWSLVTFPLFKNSWDNVLYTHILRILAREIFYVKTLERDKFDCDLEKKFKLFQSENHLVELSTHIRSLLCDNKSNVNENVIHLLLAWKEFLISLAKFEPFVVSSNVQTAIHIDILASLLNQVKISQETKNSRLLVNLSETLLILTKRWNKLSNERLQEIYETYTSLIFSTVELQNYLPFAVSVSFNSALIENLMQIRHFNTSTWVAPFCDLLNNSLRVLTKILPNTEQSIEWKFALSNVSVLNELLKYNLEDTNLLYIVRSKVIFESLFNLLTYLIEKQIVTELSKMILCLFTTAASNKALAESLLAVASLDKIHLVTQTLYAASNDKENPFISVFHLVIEFEIALLAALEHHFVEHCINFVAIHLERFCSTLLQVRTNPTLLNVKESILLLSLLHLLARHRSAWKTSHKASFEILQEDISKTLNSVIAFLVRPNLLQHVIDHPSQTPIKKPRSLEDKTLSKTTQLETSSLHQLSSEMETAIYKLLSSALAFYQITNPDILDLLENRFAEKITLNVDKAFATPNMDPEQHLSFGSLLSCFNISVKLLSKSECTSPAMDKPVVLSRVSRNRLLYILESSFSLLLSQAIASQISSDVSERDKQYISRELKTEVNSILSMVYRQPRRSTSSMSLTPTPKVQGPQFLEDPFIKVLIHLVDKSFT